MPCADVVLKFGSIRLPKGLDIRGLNRETGISQDGQLFSSIYNDTIASTEVKSPAVSRGNSDFQTVKQETSRARPDECDNSSDNGNNMVDRRGNTTGSQEQSAASSEEARGEVGRHSAAEHTRRQDVEKHSGKSSSKSSEKRDLNTKCNNDNHNKPLQHTVPEKHSSKKHDREKQEVNIINILAVGTPVSKGSKKLRGIRDKLNIREIKADPKHKDKLTGLHVKQGKSGKVNSLLKEKDKNIAAKDDKNFLQETNHKNTETVDGNKHVDSQVDKVLLQDHKQTGKTTRKEAVSPFSETSDKKNKLAEDIHNKQLAGSREKVANDKHAKKADLNLASLGRNNKTDKSRNNRSGSSRKKININAKNLLDKDRTKQIPYRNINNIKNSKTKPKYNKSDKHNVKSNVGTGNVNTDRKTDVIWSVDSYKKTSVNSNITTKSDPVVSTVTTSKVKLDSKGSSNKQNFSGNWSQSNGTTVIKVSPGGANNSVAKGEFNSIDHADLMRQVGKGIVDAINIKQNKAVLQLHPPELGKVRIELTVGQSNQVHANFIADHPDVRQALEGNLSVLRHQLAQGGLQLGHCEINLNMGEQHLPAGGGGYNQHNFSPQHGQMPGVEVSEDVKHHNNLSNTRSAIVYGAGLHLII